MPRRLGAKKAVVANKDHKNLIYWFMPNYKIWRQYMVGIHFVKMKFRRAQEKQATAIWNLGTISVFA